MSPFPGVSPIARRGLLLAAWRWRSVAYLASASVPGVIGLAVIAVLVVIGGLLVPVVAGIPVLAAVGLAGIPVAAAERWRLRIVDQAPLPDPHRPPRWPGPWGWVRTRYTEAATWRELGFTLLFVTVLWPADLAVVLLAAVAPLTLITSVVPVLVAGGSRGLWPGVSIRTPAESALAFVAGLILLPVTGHAVTAFARVRARLTRVMLAPRSEELAELARSRARLVDAFEAERRRIERDLHDGAQQRLVALSVHLGLARLDLPPGPGADQVASAHDQARLALAELRELIRGIHPRVLTDRGLAAAAADAAGRSPVPVSVDFGSLAQRPSPTAESAGYFVICEALANIAKHSGAERAWIRGHRADHVLVLVVEDDGAGGADPARGSGLTGLRDRVAAVGGTLTLRSPAGGPTVLRAELPW